MHMQTVDMLPLKRKIKDGSLEVPLIYDFKKSLRNNSTNHY